MRRLIVVLALLPASVCLFRSNTPNIDPVTDTNSGLITSDRATQKLNDPSVEPRAQTQTSKSTESIAIVSIPEADQFAGDDFCVKLRAANAWALANKFNLVDATHFAKTLTCSVDPVMNLAPNGIPVTLTVMLPASWISSTVPWLVTNPGLRLEGRGMGNTVLAYIGRSKVSSVLGLGDGTMVLMNNALVDMSVVGHLANAANGVSAIWAHQFELKNVGIWGVTRCGLYTEFAVTPTISRLHVNVDDARFYGYETGYAVPETGFCATHGQHGGIDGGTTDGTVIDIDIAGVSGWGIDLISANSMTFTSGTSENNGSGVRVQQPSQMNTFIGLDTEGNKTGADILDNGNSTHYLNVIADSRSATNSVTVGATSRYAVLDAPPTAIQGTPVITAGAIGFKRVYGDSLEAPSRVANTMIAIPPFVIPANICYGSAGSTIPATVTMAGLTTSMLVTVGFTANASAVTGWGSTGGLTLRVWPSGVNTASYVVCNSTSGAITGGAITFVLGAQ